MTKHEQQVIENMCDLLAAKVNGLLSDLEAKDRKIKILTEKHSDAVDKYAALVDRVVDSKIKASCILEELSAIV